MASFGGYKMDNAIPTQQAGQGACELHSLGNRRHLGHDNERVYYIDRLERGQHSEIEARATEYLLCSSTRIMQFSRTALG
jgi:hypothetical protein